MPGQSGATGGSGNSSTTTTAPNPQINGKMVQTWAPDAADSPAAAITQAIGAASMCWNPIPTGEFDSRKAISIVEGLIAWLRANGLQI